MIKVANMKERKDKPGVFVGRPTPLGNRFIIDRDGDRAQVIAKYKNEFKGRLLDDSGPILSQLAHILDMEIDMGEICLFCYCDPLPCHAEVIIESLKDPEVLAIIKEHNVRRSSQNV